MTRPFEIVDPRECGHDFAGCGCPSLDEEHDARSFHLHDLDVTPLHKTRGAGTPSLVPRIDSRRDSHPPHTLRGGAPRALAASAETADAACSPFYPEAA